MEAKDYVGCIFKGVGDGFWRIQEYLGEDNSGLPNWHSFKFFYCTENGTPLDKEVESMYKHDPMRVWSTTKHTLQEFLYKLDREWKLPPPPAPVDKITRKIKQMAARQKWQPT